MRSFIILGQVCLGKSTTLKTKHMLVWSTVFHTYFQAQKLLGAYLKNAEVNCMQE